MGGWTTVAELVDKLQRRWDRGTFLRAHATGELFVPLSLPVRAPKAPDVLDDLDGVRRWIEQFARDADRHHLDVEYRVVRSRHVGENRVPARVSVRSLSDLERAVARSGETDTLVGIIERTRLALPDLNAWVREHPRDAIAHADVWDRLVAVVAWMVSHDLSAIDIRHVDVPAVDSKFVERHAKLLRHLLPEVLPADRIDPSANRFSERFGFRLRPTYLRLRLLEPVDPFPSSITEIEVRTDELAMIDLPVHTVFVVENRATFLAFPVVPSSIVIFGEGFGVTTLERVPWLAEREVIYWGDIDTHGFAIVQRLRERLPETRTLLMDQQTLLAHLDHLVTEEQPTSAPLPLLTSAERLVYRDLVEDRYGASVRLEQESIRFSAVRAALQEWAHKPPLEGSRPLSVTRRTSP